MAAGVFPAAATLTSPRLASLSRGSRPLASAAASQEPVPGCLPPHGANSRGRSYLPSNQIHPSANTAASDRPGMMVERLGMSAVDSGCCLPSRCQPKIGGQGSQHLANICSRHRPGEGVIICDWLITDSMMVRNNDISKCPVCSGRIPWLERRHLLSSCQLVL